MSVVFPEPFRPMSVVTLPGCAQREADFKTWFAPKAFPMPSAQSAYLVLDNSHPHSHFEYEALGGNQGCDPPKRVTEVGEEDELGPPPHLEANREDDG